MDGHASNTSWSQLASRLAAASRVALITHWRPDGDGLGSVLALARALAGAGRTGDIFLSGPIEPSLVSIAGATPYAQVERTPPGDEYDAVVVVDTGVWSQIGPLQEWLRGHYDRAIVIDHHPQGDDVAALRMVDPSAPSASEMILSLLDALSWDVTGPVAEAIFVGLATDTGWFRYANAGARSHRAAARLLEAGVDQSRLYTVIEESYRPHRLALEARALASVEYARGGEVAIQFLSRSDFEETGGRVEDLTGLVNRPMMVDAVRVAILLAETEPERTKASFRAKPGPRGEPVIDVNRLAGRFGGGGHVFAAGARIDAPLEPAARRVRQALEEEAGRG